MARTAALTLALLLTLALVPSAWSQRTGSLTVADPDGGARWTARVTAGDDRGELCIAVRRGDDAKQRWCERLSGPRVYQYNVFRQTGPSPRAARTVVAVTFAPNVVRARVQTPEGAVTYRRRAGRPQALLVVLAGLVDRPTLRAEVEQGRRLKIVRTAPPAGVEVPDPAGAAAWRTVTEPAAGGRTCVRWERVLERFGAQPARLQGAPQCGGTALPVPVATVEAVEGRVVVLGVAGEQVRSLSLAVPGAPARTLAVEARSRAFLAVLPKGTDAAGVQLTARLAGGRTVARPLDPAKAAAAR